MNRRGKKKPPIQKGILFALIGTMLLILVLWGTVVIYPLKLLVVFFHELSHGVAAVITGGKIVEIQLSALQGGLCYTQGGWRFLVMSAGYLGSLLWGGAILLFAMRTRYWRGGVGTLGALLLLIALLFVRGWFGLPFVLVIGGLLLWSAIKAAPGFNRLLLILIGLTSCLYVVYDIASDILLRPELPSDARKLAELTHVPTLVWGVTWMLLAIVMIGWFVSEASRRPTLAQRATQTARRALKV